MPMQRPGGFRLKKSNPILPADLENNGHHCKKHRDAAISNYRPQTPSSDTDLADLKVNEAIF
jgi:hypothetical protein